MRILLSSILFMLSTQVNAHFFDSPYQCLTTHTSKRTGKEHTTLHYYHPKKNWVMKLSGVKSSISIKVANLYTPEGRYDGSYEGLYPELKKITFLTYWPYESKKEVSLDPKAVKSDCSVLSDNSVFELPYLNTLECMDPKGLGTCKAIGR